MNFLYDLISSQSNTDGKFHGGGKYAKKIFISLVLSETPNLTIFALYDSSKDMDKSLKELISKKEITLIDIRGKKLLDIISRFSIDRLYSALPFSLILYGLENAINQSGCQVYGTIHGLRTLELPANRDCLSYYPNKQLIQKIKTSIKILLRKRLIKRDISRYKFLLSKTNIIAVSNHTKYSILSFFPEANHDIHVYYSPDVTEFEDNSNEELPETIKNSSYFLLINGDRWIKNNLRSAIALDQLFSEQPNIKQLAIITGIKNPAIYLKKIKNKDRFIFYDFVSESLLKELYRHAYTFIYMSLNEGFGYPPLEAMKENTPIITSPFTSIPEICNSAVLYSNPYSIHEIKSRVLYLLQNNNLYDELKINGKKQYSFIRNKQDKDLQEMIHWMTH